MLLTDQSSRARGSRLVIYAPD
ncbi:hypothetical protein BsWGS_23090 [Bradybaena similaris]